MRTSAHWVTAQNVQRGPQLNVTHELWLAPKEGATSVDAGALRCSVELNMHTTRTQRCLLVRFIVVGKEKKPMPEASRSCHTGKVAEAKRSRIHSGMCYDAGMKREET